MSQTQATGLVRGIHRWDLVGLGINFVVGAGIFGLPSKVFSLSGPWSLLAYVVCAATVILIVLCFSEVASRFTQTGGPYLYAREAFGPFIGFEVGWLRWLAGVASFGANSNLLIDYLSYFWPAAHEGVLRALVLTVIVILMTTVNVIGVRDTTIASNVMAVGKMIPLLLFIAVGIFYIDPRNFAVTSQPAYGTFSMSVLLLVYAFTNFEAIGVPAGEVRDPQRTVPFALLTTIGIVTLLYVLIQVVCIGTLPGLAESARPLTDASRRFLGEPGVYLLSLGVVISIMGNLTVQLLVTPRMLFAMGERHDLPKLLAAVHRRFRTPHIAIIISACVVLGLALSGTFIQLVTISVMARLVMYGATCAALPVLRRKGGVPPPSFRLPAGSVISIISVVLCIWMLLNSTKREAFMTGTAIGFGLLMYFGYRLWTSVGRKNTSSSA